MEKNQLKKQAYELISGFKGENYSFGLNVLDTVGQHVEKCGKSALVIANTKLHEQNINRILNSLKKHQVTIAGEKIFPNAKPNTPREDVYRLESYILHFKPDCIVVVGGGSSIDAAKIANALASLGVYSPEIDTYLGAGLITEGLKQTGKKLYPLVAVEMAASSGSHLTRYAVVTDPVAGQKKLIVDDAIIPNRAVFDYTVTMTAPIDLTIDGAMDGLSHCLESFYGVSQDKIEPLKKISLTGLELILDYTKKANENPKDFEAREGLGLGTDLGGYAIMICGTNGAHLSSYSLVDISSHGRACGIMNIYYTVFFAPAIEEKVRLFGNLLKEKGFISSNLNHLHGKDLGIEVAGGLTQFYKSINFPTKLSDLQGFNDQYIKRTLQAAKDPQLEMKLKSLPVQINASEVDEYMAPILEAAKTGNFDLIKIKA
jgi:alcohol dehydrogenase